MKTKGGKAMNPTDAYRKEQRKKELKRNKKERKKVREVGILKKDPEAIRDQIQKLDTLSTDTDGALDKTRRHKKRQLEDTLNLVIKKRKEYEEKMKEKGEKPVMLSHTPGARRRPDEEPEVHLPEDSVYYHPSLNPSGHPPPGKPPMYKPSLGGSRVLLNGAESSQAPMMFPVPPLAPSTSNMVDLSSLPVPPPPPPPPRPPTTTTLALDSDPLLSVPPPPPPPPPPPRPSQPVVAPVGEESSPSETANDPAQASEADPAEQTSESDDSSDNEDSGDLEPVKPVMTMVPPAAALMPPPPRMPLMGAPGGLGMPTMPMAHPGGMGIGIGLPPPGMAHYGYPLAGAPPPMAHPVPAAVPPPRSWDASGIVQAKPFYVKSAAPTAVKRPLAQHTPALTAMVPASVRVKRETAQKPKPKAPTTSASTPVTVAPPAPRQGAIKPQSIDDSYSAFLEDMKALGAFDGN